jgi:hypothetical protein
MSLLLAVVTGGAPTLTVTKGDLILTGQAVTFKTTLAVSSGTLTLTGKASTASIALAVAKGDLTLTGGESILSQAVTLAVTSGSLVLTAGEASFTTTDVSVVPPAQGGKGGKRRYRIICPEFEEEELLLAQVALPKKIKLTKLEVDMRSQKADFADLDKLVKMSPYIEIKAPKIEKQLGHTEDELWLLLH